MKRTILIFVLLLMTIAMTVSAQDTSHTVIFDNFQFTLDTTWVNSVEITVVSDTSGTMPEDAPHTHFALYNDEQPFDSIVGIRVYRTADVLANQYASGVYQMLQMMLNDRRDLTPFMRYGEEAAGNNLPFLPAIAAGQIIRARAEYVDGATFSGISYVTVYQQAAEPFLSDNFLYTFQGISNDGEYYVSAIFRVPTTLFPAEFEGDFDMATFMDTIDDYTTTSTDTLNAATPDQFTPSLDTIDALIASFTFSS